MKQEFWLPKKIALSFGSLPILCGSRVLQYHCNIMQKPLNYMQPFFVKCIVQSSIHLAMGPFWMANVVGEKIALLHDFFETRVMSLLRKKVSLCYQILEHCSLQKYSRILFFKNLYLIQFTYLQQPAFFWTEILSIARMLFRVTRRGFWLYTFTYTLNNNGI